MVKKAIACLIVSTLITVLTSCSPRQEKINGSIFIVTRGGENFKLGLVIVNLLDAQQVEMNFSKIAADLDKGLADLKQEIKLLNEKSDRLSAKQTAMRQKYEKMKELVDSAEQNGSGNRPTFSKEDDQRIEELKKMAVEYERLKKWMFQESETEKDKMREEFFALPASYSSASSDAEYLQQQKAGMLNEQALWDKWHPVYVTNSLSAEELHRELDKINEEVKDVSQSLSNDTRKLENWPQTARDAFFQNLPAPLASAKSDADGKFSLEIPAKGEFVLAAKAQRQVLDSVETYFWLARVHPDGKREMQLMLSNDNLITANSSDSAVRFPMP